MQMSGGFDKQGMARTSGTLVLSSGLKILTTLINSLLEASYMEMLTAESNLVTTSGPEALQSRYIRRLMT